jgi:hypothetical protein
MILITFPWARMVCILELVICTGSHSKWQSQNSSSWLSHYLLQAAKPTVKIRENTWFQVKEPFWRLKKAKVARTPVERRCSGGGLDFRRKEISDALMSDLGRPLLLCLTGQEMEPMEGRAHSWSQQVWLGAWAGVHVGGFCPVLPSHLTRLPSKQHMYF